MKIKRFRLNRLQQPVPFLFWALAVGLLINFVPIFLPFLRALPVSFLGWALPLLSCAAYYLLRPRRFAFPLLLWLPWLFWVLMYLLLADADNAFQRTVMMLTPLLIGVVFSSLAMSDEMWLLTRRWLLAFVGIYLLASIVARGSGAAGVITASLLACWLAANYGFFRRPVYVVLWVSMVLIPVISVTRMGILAVGVTLPATLSPLPLMRRMAVVAGMLVGGLFVFQLPSVQEKMFFSGEGTLEQAFSSGVAMLTGADDVDGNFRTNARDAMARELRSRISEAYWFGNGANAVEAVTVQYFAGLTHPHNDWLRLQHDYGTLGMLLFAFTLIAQAWHAWRISRRLHGEAKVMMVAAASAFLPMVMFMLTDNVIVYVAWFGNLHFAMLGLAYGAWHAQKRRNSLARPASI